MMLLAPLDATVTHEASQVNPIKEGSLQGVVIVSPALFLHMMDHLVVYHVSAVRLFLVFLDCFEDQGDVVGVCTVRRW